MTLLLGKGPLGRVQLGLEPGWYVAHLIVRTGRSLAVTVGLTFSSDLHPAFLPFTLNMTSSTPSEILSQPLERHPLYQSTGNDKRDLLAFFHVLERLKVRLRPLINNPRQ